MFYFVSLRHLRFSFLVSGQADSTQSQPEYIANKNRHHHVDHNLWTPSMHRQPQQIRINANHVPMQRTAATHGISDCSAHAFTSRAGVARKVAQEGRESVEKMLAVLQTCGCVETLPLPSHVLHAVGEHWGAESSRVNGVHAHAQGSHLPTETVHECLHGEHGWLHRKNDKNVIRNRLCTNYNYSIYSRSDSKTHIYSSIYAIEYQNTSILISTRTSAVVIRQILSNVYTIHN